MSYKLRYKDRLVNMYRGSALFFGVAIDEALNYMLKNKDKKGVLKASIKIFEEHWETQTEKGGEVVSLPKNPYILYSKYDFDGDLLTKADWREVFKMEKESPRSRREIEEALKTVEFDTLPESERMFYNYCSWLSLLRKGPYLLEAYHRDLLPQIKEVLEVQKEITIDDGQGNKISGVVDVILRFHDDEIVVGDNKTSSMDYDSDSVETSAQLSQYKTMLNMEYGYEITKAAYLVVSKKLEKDVTKICKSCGHVGQGSHKTCDAIIEDEANTKPVRCNGEWDKKVTIKAKTQLIVQETPEHMGNNVLENYDTVVKCISQELYPRNFSACAGRFGNKCEYYYLCHKNSTVNLIDKNKKDK